MIAATPELLKYLCRSASIQSQLVRATRPIAVAERPCAVSGSLFACHSLRLLPPTLTYGRSPMSGMLARVSAPNGLRRTGTAGAPVVRLAVTLAVGALLSFSIACSEKKPEPAPAAPASTNSLKNAMAPGAPAAPPQAGGPAAANNAPEGFVSPECKAMEEEVAATRKEIDRINAEIVSPAAERAEAAYSEYQACQDDAGCLSDLARFQSRQSALASTRRAQEQAESQVEGLETKLHDISQKQDAKCNTDPL